jgi:hypothetical protein
MPPAAGQACQLPVPGCLRRGHNRTGRQNESENNSALGNSKSRFRLSGLFRVLPRDVGKELRFFFLLLLFLRCSVLDLSGRTAFG